jgi:hypothetical protein
MNINTSSWMGDLGYQIGSCQLKDLTIPGSHDSGTYGMLVPGCDAQGVDVYEQLRAGARYLDLRAMWHMADYHMYHGDVASLNRLSSVLDQIQQFLKENKNEVLILDFRLYPRKDKEELEERRDVWRDLNRRFAGQLVTREMVIKATYYHEGGEWRRKHPGWLTFNELWSSKQQILVLTNDADMLGETYIFPSHPRPGFILFSFSAEVNFLDWSRLQVNVDILLQKLDAQVMLPRSGDLLYLGTQMTPTPGDFVLLANAGVAIMGLLYTLAETSTPLIVERLANKWRAFPLNIVAGDFINKFGFCEAVIKHNRQARD